MLMEWIRWSKLVHQLSPDGHSDQQQTCWCLFLIPLLCDLADEDEEDDDCMVVRDELPLKSVLMELMGKQHWFWETCEKAVRVASLPQHGLKG